MVFSPEGKYHQKLEGIPSSIFAERKLELLYVELTSTSLSLAQRNIQSRACEIADKHVTFLIKSCSDW